MIISRVHKNTGPLRLIPFIRQDMIQQHISVCPTEQNLPLPSKKGAVQKEMGSPNYFKFTRELKSAKI